jgi:hypothetical protein
MKATASLLHPRRAGPWLGRACWDTYRDEVLHRICGIHGR